jgi:hypothetical protein
MSNEVIWRLQTVQLAKESTAGTVGTTFVSIPVTVSPYIKPVVEYVDNESWIWNIWDITEKTLVKKMTETSLEGRANTTTFWNLLTALFGQSWAPTLIETWVYKHSFTFLESNNHKSYSICTLWTSQELSLYNMLDTFDLACEVWEVLKWTWTFKWKSWASTSGKTASFVTEKPFKICKMTVKFATTTAWLTAASETKLQTLNLSFAKNVMEIMETWWACEPTSLHNQQLWITWDMEIVYRNDDTFKGYNTAWSNMAMRITITWETLIWATKYEELNFDFEKLNFDEWDRSNGLNDIVTQNLWFTALNPSNTTAYLQNTQTSSY